jgi:hypothetical protein
MSKWAINIVFVHGRNPKNKEGKVIAHFQAPRNLNKNCFRNSELLGMQYAPVDEG